MKEINLEVPQEVLSVGKVECPLLKIQYLIQMNI